VGDAEGKVLRVGLAAKGDRPDIDRHLEEGTLVIELVLDGQVVGERGRGRGQLINPPRPGGIAVASDDRRDKPQCGFGLGAVGEEFGEGLLEKDGLAVFFQAGERSEVLVETAFAP